MIKSSILSIFFKVPSTSDPMVAIYAWTGNLPGKYWFGHLRGASASLQYSDNINEKIENVEKYYDEMAKDYEEVVRNWGYSLPEAVVSALIEVRQIPFCFSIQFNIEFSDFNFNKECQSCQRTTN